MKLVPLSLLLVLALGLTGCNTLVTRRDQYSPKKGSGYWTNQANHPERRNRRHAAKPGPESGILGVSHPDYHYVDPDRKSNRMGPGPETGIFGISRTPEY